MSVVSAPALDVVIVDFNAGALVSECVASIRAHPPTAARLASVVIVDNASSEPTASFVPADAEWLTVLRNERNRGFAAACNQGASLGAAPYVLFLNPDTVLLDGSLDAPVARLEDGAYQDIGIAGIQLRDATGEVTTTCSEFPRVGHFVHRALGLDRLAPARFRTGPMVDWDHRTTRVVDQVMGAFFLVRRSLFETLGGFDERFFVYFEEVDFAARARAAGHGSLFLADAHAIHAGCGTTDAVRAFRLFLSLESRLRYALKHFSVARAAALFGVTLLVEPLSRLALAATRGSADEARQVVEGYGRLWRALPGILRRPAAALPRGRPT